MTDTPSTPPIPSAAPPLKVDRPKSERAAMWQRPIPAPVEPGYVRAEDLPPGAVVT